MATPIKITDIIVGGIYEVNPKDRFECSNFADYDGQYIKITSISSSSWLHYNILDANKKDTGHSCEGCIKPEHLINTNTNNKSMLKQLTTQIKRILSKEYQTLYRAGLINGDLELTDSGSKELLHLLLDQNKEELVTIAEDIIKEAEKADK